jgi:hypothetical protein
MKLFRFTFIHGDYDVGQAVVAADSLEEAHMKLQVACAEQAVLRSQGYPTTYHTWSIETLVTDDPNGGGDEPTEIVGDVVFTHGVDG